MGYRVSHRQKHPRSRNLRFRIVVPKDLRAKIGKREIVQSLKTSDPREADLLTAKLSLEWKTRFRDLRAQSVEEELASGPGLVDRFLQSLEESRFGDLEGAIYGMQKLIAVRAFLAWGPDEYRSRGVDLALGYMPDGDVWPAEPLDEKEEADAAMIPPGERDALVARIRLLHRHPSTFGAGFREVVEYVRAAQNWSFMRLEVLMLADATKTQIEFGTPLFHAVAASLLGRLTDYRLSSIDQELLDNFGTLPSSEPAPAVASPPEQIGAPAPPTLNDPLRPENLGSRGEGTLPLSRCLEKWKSLKAPGASAMLEADRAVARFTELFGDKPLAAITEDDLFAYRDFLETMPARLNLPAIQASGVSLREAVEQAWQENPNREKLAPTSVKKDLGALSAIFTALKQERWIRTNLAEGISVSGYSKTRKGQRNPILPMRPAMMEKLFASPLFTGCEGRKDAERTRPGDKVYQDELYWTFLLGATAGPRIEEIAQIALDDIEETVVPDVGTVVAIFVTGTGLDQSVKNDASMRVIIVHPKVVELGFLNYVHERRRKGHTRLFDLKKSKDRGTWSKELSRRANRYIDRVIVDDRRFVFHSLRHEFSDRSAVSIDGDVSRKLMGHAHNRLYGLGVPLAHAAAQLSTLDVSFVNWGKLKAAAKVDA